MQGAVTALSSVVNKDVLLIAGSSFPPKKWHISVHVSSHSLCVFLIQNVRNRKGHMFNSIILNKENVCGRASIYI